MMNQMIISYLETNHDSAIRWKNSAPEPKINEKEVFCPLFKPEIANWLSDKTFLGVRSLNPGHADVWRHEWDEAHMFLIENPRTKKTLRGLNKPMQSPFNLLFLQNRPTRILFLISCLVSQSLFRMFKQFLWKVFMGRGRLLSGSNARCFVAPNRDCRILQSIFLGGSKQWEIR